METQTNYIKIKYQDGKEYPVFDCEVLKVEVKNDTVIIYNKFVSVDTPFKTFNINEQKQAIECLKTEFNAAPSEIEEFINLFNKYLSIPYYTNEEQAKKVLKNAEEFLLSRETEVQKMKRLLKEAQDEERRINAEKTIAAKDEKARLKKEEKDNIPSIKANLIKYSDSMELFKNQEGMPYVRYIHDNLIKIYPVNSSQFQEYLGMLYFREFKDAPTEQELKSAMSVYSAMAKEGKEYELFMRSCWYDNAIWYDLGNWEAVKITKDGWEVVTNVPNIFYHLDSYEKFDSSKLSLNGNINKLNEFIDLKKENQIILYTAIVVAQFIPDIQKPIVQLSGSAGSKKSTKGKVAVGLYDNRKAKIRKTANLIRFSNDAKDLAELCSKHASMCLDNVSALKTECSDVLCMFSTGGNIEKRKLYTDNDSYSTSYQGTAFLTAVEPVFKRPDILTRAVDFIEDVQNDDTRIDESEFWTNFDKTSPEILSGIFNTISKAMRIKDDIKLNKGVSSRMSDFLKWGCAISVVNGYSQEDFIKTYVNSKIRLNDALLNTNLVCKMIIKLMEDKKEWVCNTSQLLLNLKAIAPQLGINEHSDGYPKDPVWLGRKITEFENNLKIFGIVFLDNNKSKREYRIVNNNYVKSTQESKPTSGSAGFWHQNKDVIEQDLPICICTECKNPTISFFPFGNKKELCHTCYTTMGILADNKKEEPKIVLPCSKCGLECDKHHSTDSEGLVFCNICVPTDEPEEEPEPINDYIEQQLKEHNEYLEAEEERIKHELENDINVPMELC